MKDFLILIFVNIKLIFSLNLGKDGILEIEDNTIVFNSSNFNLYDNIEFKFSTYYYCENILHYQFYDIYNRVYQIFHANHSVISSKEVIEDKKDIKYFTIYKINEVLNGLDGNFLLLKFNCTGKVEIENFSHKLKKEYIALIIIMIIIIIIITIVSIICYLKKNNKENRDNDQIIDSNSSNKENRSNDQKKDSNSSNNENEVIEIKNKNNINNRNSNCSGNSINNKENNNPTNNNNEIRYTTQTINQIGSSNRLNN